ncbi:Protease inhibitor Inh [Salinihabitans flavidus]|uniref:Protease inhibitor Inh n=2 Tax=Salinihabitans flavidus TaxID=569882 RepID=A0A1H8VDX0_9RHOB|nr:Protease inhibitor Inh [Salinihabitans flavidus]
MAEAQSRADLIEAFSGDWFIFDSARGTGSSACQLSLGTQPTAEDGPMPLSQRHCTAPLTDVAVWDVQQGQLVFVDEAGTPLAQLGGNQRRLTGNLAPDGEGVVVERANGDGSNLEIAQAVQKYRCFFLGVSSDCASEEDLKAPEFPQEAEQQTASIETLGNVVARSQPRRDSSQVGTIPGNTCIQVDQCLVASDGLWCRAGFGDTTAWIARNAVRQGEWPIITFRSDCTQDNE